MRLAQALVLISLLAFGVTGLAYLLIPGATLAIVGIESSATHDFLIRTEGVALLTGAGLLFAIRDGGVREHRIALLVMSFYFVVGSLVDIAAFAEGTVGSASAPSGAVRIVLGAACLFASLRLRPSGRSGSGS